MRNAHREGRLRDYTGVIRSILIALGVLLALSMLVLSIFRYNDLQQIRADRAWEAFVEEHDA